MLKLYYIKNINFLFGDIMNKKLLNIIEKIKLGEIIDIDGFEFTLEEYLSKDETNITFIEYLLQNNINISVNTEIDKIKESKEIASLYSKYECSLKDFELSEEDLFSFVNEKILIEQFIQDNSITYSMISKIKNNTKIIDILNKYKNYYYLASYISSDIAKKLMEKGTNDKYLIENYFYNYEFMKYLLSKIENPEIITLCQKYKKENYLAHTSENILLTKDNNITLLEKLLAQNIIPDKLNNIPKNINFIKFIVEKNLYKYLINTNEETLLLPVDNKITLLEFLLSHNQTPNIKKIEDQTTISILYKYNKLDIARNISEDLLEEPLNTFFQTKNYENKTLFEYLIDKNFIKALPSKIHNSKLTKILCNNNLELLGKLIYKNNLLMKYDDNITILEKLIKENYDIRVDFSFVNNTSVANILLKYKKYDLLVRMPLEMLLKKANSNSSYLEYILNEIKIDKFKFNLNKICLSELDNKIIAKFYITLAKHNMIKYLEKISVDILLNKTNNKTLLEELLDQNEELTLNSILHPKIKRNPKIAMILSYKKYRQEEIDIIEEPNIYCEEVLKEIYATKGIGPLTYEGNFLLKKLEKLFIKDGKSDPKLIYALICGYRMSLITNYSNTLKELKKLIAMKEDYLETFIINRSNDGAYFVNNEIFCDYAIIETIFHETGHALHKFITNYDLPVGYKEIIEIARKNPETLNKVDQFARKFKLNCKNTESIAEMYYLEFAKSYYTKETLKSIKQKLNHLKEKQIIEFKNLGIPIKFINKFIDKSYTIENYIKHEKRLFIREIYEILIENDYSKESVFGDIFDAIYEGKLASGILKNEDGILINKIAGHGLEYYYGTTNDFDELIANFSIIFKSYDSEKIFNELREIIGDETFNLLYNFYYENFIEKPKRNNL